jgi:Putative prokaryotic signal transducing protein
MVCRRRLVCLRVDDLVRVAVVENQPAAELAVSMLALEGIHALWRHTDMTTAVYGAGAAGAGGGPVEILVLPRDAERAHELLTQPVSKDSSD